MPNNNIEWEEIKDPKDLEGLEFSDEWEAISDPKETEGLEFEPMEDSFVEEVPKKEGFLSKMGDKVKDFLSIKTAVAPQSHEDLLQEDNHATVLSVGLGEFSAVKNEPKWKAEERKDGDFVTLPDSAQVGDEISEGIHKLEAPIRPEVDSETEWKRGLLAKTNDIKTNVSNAKRVFEQGGYKLIGVQANENGMVTQSNVYKLEKDGNEFIIDEDSFNSAIWDLRGDPASSIVALGTAGIGKAFGLGGLANTIDQAISKVMTGEELTNNQRAIEVGKEALLFGAGETIVKAGGKVVDGVDYLAKLKAKATEFDVKAYTQTKIINNAAKLPPREQQATISALEFAKELDVQINFSGVLDHPQADQAIQILARNPLVKQDIRNSEFDGREKLLNALFEVLEDAGPKADIAKLDDLIRQEFKRVKDKRSGNVKALYATFEDSAKDLPFVTGKKLMSDIDEIAVEYGGSINGKMAIASVGRAKKQFDNLMRIDSSGSDVAKLNHVSSLLFRMGQSSKPNDKPAYAFYTGARDRVLAEIDLIAKSADSSVANDLAKARNAHREKLKIWGDISEFSEIRKLLDSNTPNNDIHKLLSGKKGIDNAELLKKELSGSKNGDALLGALGRKIIDDDLVKATEIKTSKAIYDVLSSEKMDVVKVLLGEERFQTIENVRRILGMQARTEKFIMGAQSEMNNGTARSVWESVTNRAEQLFVRLQQKRVLQGLINSTMAQDLVLSSLKGIKTAKTTGQLKQIDNYLIKSAKILEQETDLDFSDIYDPKKVAKVKIEKRKKAEVEAEVLKKEVETFEIPDITELNAVAKLANKDDVVVLSHSIRNIQGGDAIELDVRRYIKARNSIDEEALSMGIEKESVIRLPSKYRNENIEESLVEMTRLRDYLMSNPELKYGNEFAPNSVKALMSDLERQGFPRSTKHDTLYDEMKEMYAQLKPRIDEAYGNPKIKELDEPLGADGNPVLMKGIDHLLAGGIAGVEVDEEGSITLDPEKFILGMGGYAAAKAMLKNPRVQKEMKDLLEFGIEKVEKKYEGTPYDLRSFMTPINDSGIAKPKGISQEIETFGENFAEYATKPKEAIDKLIKEKRGQVQGALYHPEVGDIDLVWGKVLDADNHTGYGLAHIIDKHGEDVARRLDDIVMGGKFLKQKGNTVELVNGDDLAVIKLDWNGEDRKWVVTTFEMPPRQTITDDVVKSGESGNLSPKAGTSITQKKNEVKKDTK